MIKLIGKIKNLVWAIYLLKNNVHRIHAGTEKQ
jgi:hypothetical protein